MKKTILIAIILATMLMAGCSAFYQQQSVRMPLVSQKGELVVAVDAPIAALSTMYLLDASAKHEFSMEGFFYNASASYAFADHWAAQLSSRRVLDTRHEAMVGWYTPLGGHATVEVYGGYSYARCVGSPENREVHGYVSREEDGAAHALFVQGDIGFPSYTPKWPRRCASFTAGVGLRLGGVYSSYTARQYGRPDNGPVVMTGSSTEWSICYEIQPILKLGIGGERMKCEVSAGLLTFGGWNAPSHDPLTASLTLSYRIPLLKEKNR